MPPSTYFASSQIYLEGDNEDMESDEDETTFTDNDKEKGLAYSESLLDFAEKKGFGQHMLKVHYRSEHPYLIDFSNHAFYS
jgi:superfamily I DNA and/or RNA helicase